MRWLPVTILTLFSGWDCCWVVGVAAVTVVGVVVSVAVPFSATRYQIQLAMLNSVASASGAQHYVVVPEACSSFRGASHILARTCWLLPCCCYGGCCRVRLLGMLEWC